ncbi:ATPase associated with various cellular activities AAA_3 [Hymenobacter roseosalivarius DSM 11622]|uniref:ATPase associated with various cellular activities AAA_3 n=1 Tax=Hymenobacter roseosalivarius DSM 11622 TaxID=645990 RepID=A0A1W1VLC6_9BACT|nr:MoxR family ATPase [Hymenobacter roseosalivarius]SMB94020.1 ATPase associated with various cellular activities AAA_3 [Hymenobacter roseosalivarius DSM 11622]
MTEQEVHRLLAKLPPLKEEIAKVIVGQSEVLDEVLVALLAGGHALLEGVPGLAKTLLVRTLAAATDMSFRRIQFTPDLMPTDILGTEVLEEDHGTGHRSFKFNEGPIFASLVLADEINRTPPKTQAALLEAMQEGHVTYAGQEHALPKPFFLLATQNPIEQAGTYPLPEAQLDRFLLYVRIGYPSEQEELAVLSGTTGTVRAEVKPVLGSADIRQLQQLVRQVSLSPELLDFVNRLVRATRPATTQVKFIQDYGRWGAGPRAGQALILCAKARALLQGRFAVTLDDLRTLAPPVLRHRVLLNFNAEAENITADDAVAELLKAVAV